MNHDVQAVTLTKCPNCGHFMVETKFEGKVLVCISKSCGWIAGPDEQVAYYLETKNDKPTGDYDYFGN
jgi:hypothetical protein